MVTSSKRAYATPRAAAPRAPAPVAVHCWPMPLQETLRHSKAGLAQPLWGLLVHQVLFDPPKHLWWVWGLILNAILPLLPSCWAFSFAFACGVSFLVESNIFLLTAVQQQVVILEFSQKMSASPSTLPSWIYMKVSLVYLSKAGQDKSFFFFLQTVNALRFIRKDFMHGAYQRDWSAGTHTWAFQGGTIVPHRNSLSPVLGERF